MPTATVIPALNAMEETELEAQGAGYVCTVQRELDIRNGKGTTAERRNTLSELIS